MRLPRANTAVVAERKVTGYLLSAKHPAGRHKAAWFTGYGFEADKWAVLAASLKRHAAECEMVREETSPYGTRYVVEGPMVTPDGRNPVIRTVWFVETGDDTPQLVTAYPPGRSPT